jgi:hypothetical protein
MIHRDQHGIIVQHPDMDGGDSLSRTSIMAISGSEQDRKLLLLFARGSLLCRHPYQTQSGFNDPTSVSRDQVVCAAMTGELLVQALHYADIGRVNKDWLDFGVRYAFYKRNGFTPPLTVRLLGPLNLFLSLLWNCFIRPDEEQNQFACICIGMGPWWCQQLCCWHPDIVGNIFDYFEGWRDQPEIASKFVEKLLTTARQEEE